MFGFAGEGGGPSKLYKLAVSLLEVSATLTILIGAAAATWLLPSRGGGDTPTIGHDRNRKSRDTHIMIRGNCHLTAREALVCGQ